jgi:copper chaperone
MIRLKVTGMTCGHCENAVRKALEAVPGVSRVVAVSRDEGAAVVEGDAEEQALIEAIREEGYETEVAS